MKTLVVGLGNPLLGDDGVGWQVAEAVKRQLQLSDFGCEIERTEFQAAICNPPSTIEVDCLALGGLSLMERLVGYDRAILVDAVTTGRPPGTIACFGLDDLPEFSTAHSSAAHDVSLQNALRLGRALGAPLPAEVLVVGVEAQRVYDFSETLSPAVQVAVPAAVQAVLRLLQPLRMEG